MEGNLESFNILENVGGSQRVLNNVERYALYVSQALQNEGGDIVKNQAGENIGVCVCQCERMCLCLCVCV